MFKHSCKEIASEIVDQCKRRVNIELKLMHLHIFTNMNYAGQQYLHNKMKKAIQCGINVHVHYQGESRHNCGYNLKSSINSCKPAPMIVQLPYHQDVDQRLNEFIDLRCDADGLVDDSVVKPATAQGIYYLLEKNQLISGKQIVIIGRSNLVGQPLAKMLINTDATVTLCHSKTPNLVEHCKMADVIVVAVGKVGFLTNDMIDPNKEVHIVDVGINCGEDGKLRGDVAKDVAGEHTYVTPVPEGVGLLTTACLVENIIKLYNKHRNFYESDKG